MWKNLSLICKALCPDRIEVCPDLILIANQFATPASRPTPAVQRVIHGPIRFTAPDGRLARLVLPENQAIQKADLAVRILARDPHHSVNQIPHHSNLKQTVEVRRIEMCRALMQRSVMARVKTLR